MNNKEKEIETKRKIGIYKITNPKGKIYIGQSIDIEKRFNIHKGLYGNKSTKLERSFLKYGIKNHIFDIIEECCVSVINERERYWINYYNSISEGLNIEEGGNKTILSDYSKLLISINKKGHECYNNPERGEKISKSLIGRKKYWDKGKEKKGKKQLEKFKNHVSQLHSIPIIQYDLKGNIIKEWNSIINASKFLGIHRESISSNLRQKTKTAGGSIWKYKN